MKQDIIIKKSILNHVKKFYSAIAETDANINELNKFLKILLKFQNKNKVHIFGNGGSASIASHFSMDLTNNSKIKCFNYNDPTIITCFANDFKFENWISRTINKYGEKGDLLITISSSGKSKNMLNAVKAARKKKFYNVITFTGFNKSNPLKSIGDVNLWINSKEFNIIENTHQFWLLMMVDIIKKFTK